MSDSLVESQFGLTARLTLAGKPCSIFGDDIINLTVEVTYETPTRQVY
jgi:alpha-glucosidase